MWRLPRAPVCLIRDSQHGQRNGYLGKNQIVSGEEKILEIKDPDGRFITTNANFHCSHCLAFAQHKFGRVANIEYSDLSNSYFTPLNYYNNKIDISTCTSCNEIAIYVACRQIYPAVIAAPDANPDIPEEIKFDFNEAREIHSRSPVELLLLRLCIQKLLPHIGVENKNINEGIKELVANRKIPTIVQKALDTVRVIGNESVHPGTIDLKDDIKTVTILFNLVNFIVENSIAEPKRINKMFGNLPPDKIKGIADRDAPHLATQGHKANDC
jgi:hypothetical protein